MEGISGNSVVIEPDRQNTFAKRRGTPVARVLTTSSGNFRNLNRNRVPAMFVYRAYGLAAGVARGQTPLSFFYKLF